MIVECAAIGTGFGLIIWGSRRIIYGNDTADEATAKVLSEVPGLMKKHIRDVEITPFGIKFHIRANAPEYTERKVEENVEIEGDGSVEVERDGEV